MAAGGYNVGESSPFMKRVLVPFWVARILLMLFEIGVYALSIGVVAHYRENLSSYERAHPDEYNVNVTRVIAIASVILVIILACLVLDIVCIVMRARRTLSPRLFLIINVAQSTVWVVLFILSMVGSPGPLALFLNVIILLSFLGVLIYASVIFHRFRKGKIVPAYAAALNPELHNMHNIHNIHANNTNTGYAPGYPTDPLEQHRQPQPPQQAGFSHYEPTAYPQQQQYQGQHYGQQQQHEYPKASYYDAQAPPELHNRSLA